MRPGFLRAVTHLDLTDDDIDRAAELVPQALGASVRKVIIVAAHPAGRER